MDANLLLWIGQVLLALAFGSVGFGHAMQFEASAARPRMAWMGAVGRRNMAVIGVLEILGAIGLIAPAATGILPWLTPLAAACLAALMAFALVFHVRRTGEVPNAVFNTALGVIAALVAYGRFVVAPI